MVQVLIPALHYVLSLFPTIVNSYCCHVHVDTLIVPSKNVLSCTPLRKNTNNEANFFMTAVDWKKMFDYKNSMREAINIAVSIFSQLQLLFQQ